MDLNELIAAVKAHALKHYEDAGQAWDTVIECWETSDFAAVIGGAKTPEEAIKLTARHLRPFASYRADIQATAF